MNRIFSRVVSSVMTLAITAATVMLCSDARAQSGPEYKTDPTTGIVYQKVVQTIDRPVVETTIEKREQTVYRPQTVTETKPQSRTVYTPVVEYNWEPRLQGRWNPFRQPAVEYHHVAKTHWESRNEVVHRTNTRTEWVAEKRTIDVPQRTMRMQREQRVVYEPVGPSAANSIASRLRPLDSSGVQVGRLASTSTYSPPRIASSTVGKMPSAPTNRTASQAGLRPIDLYPTAPMIPGQPIPPVGGGVGVARGTSLPFYR